MNFDIKFDVSLHSLSSVVGILPIYSSVATRSTVDVDLLGHGVARVDACTFVS